MRIVLALFFCHLGILGLKAQTWKTIFKSDSYIYTPYQQFSINPYTNDIWLMGSYDVSVIENDGTVQVFDDNEFGVVESGADSRFAFTNEHVYLCRGGGLGLYSLDDYNPILRHSFIDYQGRVCTDGDTLFIINAQTSSGTVLIKYTASSTIYVSPPAPRLVSKNSYLYGDIGTQSYIIYYPTGSGSYQVLQTDPQYLGGSFNDWKFSRLTDTLYVGGKEGISLAYAYDFFDTLTPNNTTGMLSPNVLEMEFDHEDKLWAIFGDSSDEPIGIAKLEGANWVDYTANCPVDFSNFLGMEIDTLGNVWIADDQALHTLIGPDSPAWLSLAENNLVLQVYPNPANNLIHIDAENFAFASLHDMNGREIQRTSETQLNIAALQSGVYLLHVNTNDGRVAKQKIVKE